MLRRLSSIPSLVALSKTPDETWQKRPQAYTAQCKVMLGQGADAKSQLEIIRNETGNVVLRTKAEVYLAALNLNI